MYFQKRKRKKNYLYWLQTGSTRTCKYLKNKLNDKSWLCQNRDRKLGLNMASISFPMQESHFSSRKRSVTNFQIIKPHTQGLNTNKGSGLSQQINL